MAAGRRHVVDKMPSNFLLCGLIRLILPDARIIHCRRDPVDTCLSCYTKLFAGEQAFTYDQTRTRPLPSRLSGADGALARDSARVAFSRGRLRGRRRRPRARRRGGCSISSACHGTRPACASTRPSARCARRASTRSARRSIERRPVDGASTRRSWGPCFKLLAFLPHKTGCFSSGLRMSTTTEAERTLLARPAPSLDGGFLAFTARTGLIGKDSRGSNSSRSAANPKGYQVSDSGHKSVLPGNAVIPSTSGPQASGKV